MDTPLLEQSSSEIPSLLVPIVEAQLIVPTVTVAEMMPYQPPIVVHANVPSWYLGNLYWRGLQIPMISFEAINGGSIAPVQPASQVTIFNSTGVSSKVPFICIPTQGIPRLSRVTAQEITQLPNAVKPYETMHVSVAGEPAVLPDVSGLENAWLDLNLV